MTSYRSPHDILRAVSVVVGIPTETLKKARWSNTRALAAFYVVSLEFGHTHAKTARIANRNHATVYYGVRKFGSHEETLSIAVAVRAQLQLPTWRERLREHGVETHVS